LVRRKKKPTRRERLEKQRLEAGKQYETGARVMEVAQQFGVAYRTAMDWKTLYERGGLEALRSRGKPGPARRLGPEQLEDLKQALVAGAQSAGYENPLWTLRRVRQLIRQRYGVRYTEVAVWKLLRALGWSPQKPERRAREADPQKIAHWKGHRWPELFEGAQQQRRTIVFVDESGFSQKPARKRTWAPKGQTPILEFNFNTETHLSHCRGKLLPILVCPARGLD
jgi:transposase